MCNEIISLCYITMENVSQGYISVVVTSEFLFV